MLTTLLLVIAQNWNQLAVLYRWTVKRTVDLHTTECPPLGNGRGQASNPCNNCAESPENHTEWKKSVPKSVHVA